MVEERAADTPALKQRLNIRGGLKRLAIVITILYASAFAFWLYNEVATRSLLTANVPDANFRPARALNANESLNPRVQFLLTLIAASQDGGLRYSDTLLVAAGNSPRRVGWYPPYEVRLAQEALRARGGERVIILPGPETPITLSPNMTLDEARASLEETHTRWRWPVTFAADGPCIHATYGACEDSSFRVSPRIHCQASFDERYHSDQFYLEWIPATCGELSMSIRAAALERQSTIRTQVRDGIVVWFLGWLAAFVFGKVFWWVAAGFRRPT